jgi:hypothetical protein
MSDRVTHGGIDIILASLNEHNMKNLISLKRTPRAASKSLELKACFKVSWARGSCGTMEGSWEDLYEALATLLVLAAAPMVTTFPASSVHKTIDPEHDSLLLVVYVLKMMKWSAWHFAHDCMHKHTLACIMIERWTKVFKLLLHIYDYIIFLLYDHKHFGLSMVCQSWDTFF